MKISLFIPTLGTVPTSMCTNLMKINSKHKIEVITTSNVLIHAARNLAIDQMLENNSDYLVMIDSDNPCIYNDFIDIMTSHNKDVISGVIRLRLRSEDLNICFTQKIEGMNAYINYQNIDGLDELQEVGNCGSGLVCLSRKLCKDMKDNFPRPFENKLTYYIQKEGGEFIEFSPKIFKDKGFKTNKQGGLNIRYRELSEDYLFFERCQSLGYKIYADTRLKCMHLQDQKYLEV